jgi:hypothetical protein
MPAGPSERQVRQDSQSSVSEEHDPSINQRRHEPTPASHRAGGDEPAVRRNEEHQAGGHPGPAGHPVPTSRGQAVRDLLGGPQPQGDVPDAPATQVAAADNEEDRIQRVRHVANAVPGKPDGEVDTRS